MAKIIFSKRITAGEVSRITSRLLGREPENVEVGGSRMVLQFDPPLDQAERQELDQRFSRLGYFLLEEEDIPEPEP